MGPLRIVVILILLYIGYRLIVGSRRQTPPSSSASETQGIAGDDILEKDPVCGKFVPRQQAIQAELDGTTHYFCSEECCKQYRDGL
ncbi:MAG: hypothetical protein CSA20_07660 [Deltaproteobacteria bacterium]|nr:MAG: hypothetical protein CSB32_00265 [Desulfobacterales bacterium]PIE72506.1 MAG: hypothetical protein CSA20_07660 [Deltaproteobacteria bacterium]